jgi:nucleoside-diphosphate-sugar epimerase
MAETKTHVLVTGGAGFIGSLVTRQLVATGHRVRVLDSFRCGGQAVLGMWSDPSIEITVGDITDASIRTAACEGVDAVVHLAAIVGDPACSRDTDLAWAVNRDATLGLIDAAKSAGVRRFVFSSTCSNYGVSAPDEIVHEDSELNPVSVYAMSKVESERSLLAAVDDIFDPIVLRFATVYGVSPRMRFDLLVNDFTREAVARKNIVIYGEQFWRPHIHVADVARAVCAIVTAPRDDARPRVFNVGDDGQNFQKITIAELAREAVPGTALELVKKDEDPRSYRVSFQRIRDTFGFQIERTAADGVAEVKRLIESGALTDYDDGKYVN